MNIKDYLHLYLGCECKVDEGEGHVGGLYNALTRIEYGATFVLDGHKLWLLCTGTGSPMLKYVKPILRPLSDMTEEEVSEITLLIYRDIFGYYPDTRNHQLLFDEDGMGFICYDEDNDKVGLTIEMDCGIEFSHKDEKLKVKQFEITKRLLSKHFDLFGLIEAGLAIDQTTLKQSSNGTE